MNLVTPVSKCHEYDVTYNAELEEWFCDQCGCICELIEGDESVIAFDRELNDADDANKRDKES